MSGEAPEEMDELKPPYSMLRSIALGSALAEEIERKRESARNPDSGKRSHRKMDNYE